MFDFNNNAEDNLNITSEEDKNTKLKKKILTFLKEKEIDL